MIPWNFWGLIVFDCVFSVKIVSISIVSVSLARSPSPFSEAMVSDEICAVFQRDSPRCANIEQGSLLYGTNIAGVGFCIACTLGQVVQNKTFLSGREGYMQKSTLKKYHQYHGFIPLLLVIISCTNSTSPIPFCSFGPIDTIIQGQCCFLEAERTHLQWSLESRLRNFCFNSRAHAHLQVCKLYLRRDNVYVPAFTTPMHLYVTDFTLK